MRYRRYRIVAKEKTAHSRAFAATKPILMIFTSAERAYIWESGGEIKRETSAYLPTCHFNKHMHTTNSLDMCKKRLEIE